MTPIIDAHVHIWTHNPRFPWAAGEHDLPAQERGPGELSAVLREHGVRGAVLVQYIQYRWDNRYVAHALKSYPSLYKGVCRVDPEDPAGPDHLSDWSENHGFQGVRLSPASDARGDWFSGPLMPPLFQRAAALGVPVILLIKPSRLPDLTALLEKVPTVNVMIDHLADCIHPRQNHLTALLALARYPNVFLKIGHIPQNSDQSYPWQDTHPALERIFETYSARRMMWGSDWPFCLSWMSYWQSIAYIQQELTFLTPEERAWVLGKTASQFWPFAEQEQVGEA